LAEIPAGEVGEMEGPPPVKAYAHVPGEAEGEERYAEAGSLAEIQGDDI